MTSRTATAAPFVPDTDDLDSLRKAAAHCEGCELHVDATQTVFGVGPVAPPLLLVGEQPGDVEDVEGEPFVGPAGRLLDQALDAAGIDRSTVYLTNAVKHFRFTRDTGTRRIHQKPGAGHVKACLPWLSAELSAATPTVVVALGATAAAALLGREFRLTRQRGEVIDWPPAAGPFVSSPLPIRSVVATIHPSAVLRMRGDDRRRGLADLVADLRVARDASR